MLTTEPIRIVVIDDHPVVRDGVAAQLQQHRKMTVVGYAVTAADGLRVCAAEQPDVVLLELRLPDAPAAKVVAELRRPGQPGAGVHRLSGQFGILRRWAPAIGCHPVGCGVIDLLPCSVWRSHLRKRRAGR
ncbi:response regulator transcription factor [Streptomyces sp. B21-108]|uniref:response regulator transcription factor n=1 Tax=Streptomyces sp. B21-108 TaxID=3039419 RepID=UPI003FA7B396